MKTVAIICEYNPLTNGHVRHLVTAKKETGCDTVVCVMSGSFVQRGEGAVMDKYKRAKHAVYYGADMVVELPLVYAISPADNFAYGAVKTASALPDLDCISFGSECGDLRMLEKMANFLLNEPQEYKILLNQYLSEGNSFPKSRSLAFQYYTQTHEEYKDVQDILNHPNNMLGIAYIMAAKKLNLSVRFHTIKREENDNDQTLDCEYPSANAVRLALRQGRLEEVKKAVPSLCLESLKATQGDGTTLDDLCLYKMKEINGYRLAEYYDVSEGLHNRMKLAAAESVRFSEYLEKVKTKRYTMAKIKRISLYTLFDITKSLYQEAMNCPPYLFVLSLSGARKDLLSAIQLSCPNTLLRYSDINKIDKSIRFMVKLDFRAQGTLALINKTIDISRKFIIV